MYMLVTALSYTWLVVLIITLCLFGGLLVGGTVFGIYDLGTLLRHLKRQHEQGLEDASDDTPGPVADDGT